jgi:SulP family sulfate permease
VNQQAGAVSQWSGVFAAVAVAVTVLLFAPYARYIPRAALAGLLVLAAYRMVDGRQLLFHLRASRFDAGLVIATALAAIFISVEFCIVVGVFLSFVLYVPRAAQVQLTPLTPSPDGGLRELRAGDAPSEWLRAYELEGELFFGAEAELAKHFATIERAVQHDVRAVLLMLRRARNSDAAFLSHLKRFHELLQQRHIMLLLGGVRPDVMTALENIGLNILIGRQRIFADCADDRPSGAVAIEFALAQIGERPRSS